MMAQGMKVCAQYAWMVVFGIAVAPAASGICDDPARAKKPHSAASLPKKPANDPSYAQRNSLPEDWESHPLAPALNLARVRGAFLRDHVRDFTCLLVKRERIGGTLRGYEYLATKIRREQREEEQIITPFSVYCRYLGPARVRGRKILYVQGQNDGKMLVRKGGTRFSYVTVSVEPTSAAAMRESRYPITELGLDAINQRLIDQTLKDIRNDPAGENSRVTFFEQASVDERPCMHVQVVHPNRREGFNYHLANIYLDNELHMPIRVETYDWPDQAGDEPVLQEEYTLTRLKLNVGLTDADFSPSILKEE